jgi:HTH-type transcriptional regulator/antitoxin MqsA
MARFDHESFRVEHRGDAKDVADLAGWRCPECGEVEFDTGSANRYAEAGDELVLAARRRLGLEIREMREQLGLTQAKAALLTGGGHNAFSRYERGEAVPMPSVVNLLKLLVRHPELLHELQEA